MQRTTLLCCCTALVACGVISTGSRPAEASLLLDVTYTSPSQTGPLSFGLSALPTSVDASFHLGPGVEGEEPAIREFFLGDVISADLSFGDGTWTVSELNSFFMKTISGVPTELNYEFNPITTPTVVDGPVLNFPLNISGTDIATGEAFEYIYAESTQTLTAAGVPEPSTVVLWSLGVGILVSLNRRRRKQAARGVA